MKDFFHRSAYHIIRIFFLIAGMIPVSIAQRCGNLIGDIWYAVDGNHRRIAMDNMVNAYLGEKDLPEIRQLTRRVFRNLGQVLFEIGRFRNSSPEQLRKMIRVEGVEHMRNAWKAGNGALLFTAHLGNWELLPYAGYISGCPINVVYRPLDFKPMNQFIEECRTRFGAKLIPTSRSMRKIFRAQQKGEIVAFLMDQSSDWYDGVWVDFFGRRTCTNKGLALLARKTEAPVMPVFIAREKGGFVVEFGPELPHFKTRDKTKDVDTNTQQYNERIEAFIRRYPDQWFWVHRRWKKRPYLPWPR